MSSTHRAAKSSVGSLLASTVVLASVVALPISMAMPAQANAVELKIAAAKQAGADLAITQRPMEEVEAPTGYSDAEEKPSQEVTAERQELQAADGAISATTEELSLARALVSSSTAIVGVTFPRENADEDVTVSYRQRSGNEWSEWTPMELAEPSQEARQAGTAIQGTEPIPLVDIDEVEAKVTTADGKSIPAVVLNVIEPELTPQTLEGAQEAKHGAQEVQAAESMLSETTPEAQKDHGSSDTGTESREEEPQVKDKNEENSLPSHAVEQELTPAEEAEQNAQLSVPAGTSGAQGAVSALAPLRATGLSADGKSYVTDIPGLTITTRKGWGADESVMDWDPETVTFKGAVVHHTAGSNNYTKAQVPNVVRGVYHYHAVTLGWGDVGYHLLVDKFGGVWEGRAGGLTRATEGGHAFGANTATFGISVLGDYMHLRPSDEAIDAVAKAVAWKLRVHKIHNVDGTITVKGNHWGKSSVKIPIIAAHREVGGTDCPGDAFMTRMPEIRTKVAEYLKAANERPSAASQSTPIWQARQKIGSGWNIGQALYAGAFSAEGRTDAMLIDRQGLLWLYPGEGNTRFPYARKQIGRGWHSVDQVNAGTDFDGDGRTDIVARVINTGELRLYVGDGKGGFKTVKKIGTGWNMFSAIYVLPNMNDGTPVVYGVEKNTGKLRAYLTDGRGSFSRTIIMGGGWNVMRDFVSVTDKTGDRRSDLIVTDEQGDMWLYEGKNGSIGSRVQIGRGWEGFSPILNAGATGTLWTVSPDGALFRYTFEGMRKSH